MGFLRSLCCYLASWVVSSRSPSPTPSRRHGRRWHIDDYSSNGDMERSPSEWSAKDEEEQEASASATQLAQLGCVNGRPGLANMTNIVNTSLLDDTEILKHGGSSSGTIRKGMWVSDKGLDIPVAILRFSPANSASR